jgi:hypothetical protein
MAFYSAYLMVTKVHLLAIVYTRKKFPTEVTPFQKGVL